MGLGTHLPHNVRGFKEKGREGEKAKSRREEDELLVMVEGWGVMR